MCKIIVTNIQRFSLHDGPGIRTTVFLKDVIFVALGVLILKILVLDMRSIFRME